MVAVPDAEGVQLKTFSGDVPLLAQVPASALDPLVMPLKVPPAAGTTVGLAQLPDAMVVLVVVDTTVDVVVVGRGGMVTGTVATLFDSASSEMRWNGSTATRSV
jgi:hypothetical protein